MISFDRSLLAGFAVAATLLASTANAATYNFNLTYDGAGVSLDPGSDVPDGTGLNVGDTFNLTLSAIGAEFWTINAPYFHIFPLTFAVNEGATRTADIVTNFLNDGSNVQSIIDNSATQQFVHVGGQIWSLPSGLVFDQVALSWTLLTIDTNGPTTIFAPTPDFFSFQFGNLYGPFYNSAGVSFSASVVPIPAALPLLLTGIAGAVGVSRRRKGKAKKAA